MFATASHAPAELMQLRQAKALGLLDHHDRGVRHIHANFEAGPLDQRYTYTWETFSESDRWRAAITKAVGPSPPLAPGALALGGLCLLFATVRHPALATRRVPAGSRTVEALILQFPFLARMRRGGVGDGYIGLCLRE